MSDYRFLSADSPTKLGSLTYKFGRQYFPFQQALILSADKWKILRCDWLANVINNNNKMESDWVHDEIVELINSLYEFCGFLVVQITRTKIRREQKKRKLLQNCKRQVRGVPSSDLHHW